MRGRPNPNAACWPLWTWRNGSPKTIRGGGSRKWPTRPWNGCHRSSTACMRVWVGPPSRPSGC